MPPGVAPPVSAPAQQHRRQERDADGFREIPDQRGAREALQVGGALLMHQHAGRADHPGQHRGHHHGVDDESPPAAHGIAAPGHPVPVGVQDRRGEQHRADGGQSGQLRMLAEQQPGGQVLRHRERQQIHRPVPAAGGQQRHQLRRRGQPDHGEGAPVDAGQPAHQIRRGGDGGGPADQLPERGNQVGTAHGCAQTSTAHECAQTGTAHAGAQTGPPAVCFGARCHPSSQPRQYSSRQSPDCPSEASAEFTFPTLSGNTRATQ